MTRTSSPHPPAAPPSTAKEGAAHVRAFMLDLFARKDGEAVDWRLMSETLFVASFAMLDKLPDDVCRKVAGRAHEGAYDRMANGPKLDLGANNTGGPESDLMLTNTDIMNLLRPTSAKETV